jgi:His-Xaa-Ser system protein HxsD
VEVLFNVDSALFSADVVARTAHRYSGNYFVRLETSPSGFIVSLTARRPGAITPELEAQFRTDLLDDRLRALVEAQTEKLKTALTHAAFVGAGVSPPT